MNNAIQSMIGLQALWDEVMDLRGQAERHANSIRVWMGRAEKANKDLESLRLEIRNLSASIKKGEIELGERDAHASRLDSRRGSIKTQKELAALESELAKVNAEKGAIEEDLIAKMDLLASREEEQKRLGVECGEVTAQAAADVSSLEKKIEGLRARAESLEKDYEGRAEGLPADIRGRFKKLIASRDAKAIVPLEDGACGACHTSIPVQVALEAAKNDKIVICTYCGKFLYGTGS